MDKSTAPTSEEKIIAYYDSCEVDYRRFWDLENSQAMHAGYWDNTTRTLSDALRRENEILAEMAAIKNGDKVLDAGCGVGGSSFFLARHLDCDVIGISLSKRQVDKATAFANKKQFNITPRFLTANFHNTPFNTNSFDIVWALESVCHSTNKRAFVQEAFRILKPQGRLIVADGFAIERTLSAKEQLAMQRWLKGWGVGFLESSQKFNKYLMDAGFQDLEYREVTRHVLPSSRRLYYIALPALLFSKIGEWLGLRTSLQSDNLRAAYYQYTTLKKGLWHYAIFCVTKP